MVGPIHTYDAEQDRRDQEILAAYWWPEDQARWLGIEEPKRPCSGCGGLSGECPPHQGCRYES